ncbi:MAG TPA: TadE/TadG family type IV pilus assembly protein [Stellaceae bacterium]|nr:TadE/TadG family type IV pilus assembly protein [Stellaceae bacterium]
MGAWPLLRCRAGTAAVEMAFIAPILVLMAAGMIDFGLGIYDKMLVADAAQAGATYAQLNANCSNISTCFNEIGCATNGGTTGVTNASSCIFDQNVATAAAKAHGSGNSTSTAVVTAASVLYCCTANLTLSNSSCTEPPAAAPTCTSGPSVGTYVLVSTSSTYTTLLPYNFVGRLLDVDIPSSFSLNANQVVRIQ